MSDDVYIIAVGDSLADLYEDVNELLGGGYELAGNLVVVENGYDEDGFQRRLFYQPMINREDED